jgi:hypothetical protein
MRTVFLIALASMSIGSAVADQGVTLRASMAMGGVQAQGNSERAKLSGDGSTLVFNSDARDLVPGDFRGFDDVFAFNTITGAMSLVSTTWQGGWAEGDSSQPYISRNGRWVAFYSWSPDIVALDTNGMPDAFVRDLIANETHLVSLSSSEVQSNGPVHPTDITPDGMYVVMVGDASNLVAGDTNWFNDCFVRDRYLGNTERVSVSSQEVEGNGGSWACTVSEDGNLFTFVSEASNLVPGDTNGEWDVFLRNRSAGTTTRLSLRQGGAQCTGRASDAYISDNGQFVAITTTDPLLPIDTNDREDVYLIEVATGNKTLISARQDGLSANWSSRCSGIAPAGNRVLFSTDATDLILPDRNGSQSDLIIWEQATGNTRVLYSSTGIQQNDWAWYGDMSADGRIVTIGSRANNLVANDTNGDEDVFVRFLDHELDVLAPQGFNIVRGKLLDGTLASLIELDDEHLRVMPGITFSTQFPGIIVEVNANTTVSDPSRIEFIVEPSPLTTPFTGNLEIALFNYDTNAYEVMQLSGLWPGLKIVGTSQNAGRFVSPSNDVKARLSVFKTGGTNLTRWGAKFDMARWALIP